VSYEFHPDTETEHLDSLAFYESKKPGLGASYLADFERALIHVCESPQRYPTERIFNIRTIPLEQFPYTVHYREVSGKVQVLAVAHHRRRPQYWLGRI